MRPGTFMLRSPGWLALLACIALSACKGRGGTPKPGSGDGIASVEVELARPGSLQVAIGQDTGTMMVLLRFAVPAEAKLVSSIARDDLRVLEIRLEPAPGEKRRLYRLHLRDLLRKHAAGPGGVDLDLGDFAVQEDTVEPGTDPRGGDPGE